MYKNKTFIGIIPARSGSKGLPHKNIRLFAGKPLIAWSILAARQSGILDEVFVSTDSGQYAEIAMQCGANAPFLRPPELSGDAAPASAYILHALREYREKLKKTFDYFILLQPTAPLRTAGHIKAGAMLAVDEELTSVVSYSPFDIDLRLVHELPEDMHIPFSSFPSPNDTLRQEAPLLYKVNGLIYISQCAAYEHSGSFYGPHSKAMVIDKQFAVDIDNEDDFVFAEFIAKRSGLFE